MTDYDDETPVQHCGDTEPHLPHRDYRLADGYVQCDGTPFPDVTINGADLRRLFDLAVDTPLLCSGSFESDDVKVLRGIGAMIGADLEAITPDEFIVDYPHHFVPPAPFRAEVMPVTEYIETGPISSRGRLVRDETHEEYEARRALSLEDRCEAGTYGRRCGRPKADERHA